MALIEDVKDRLTKNWDAELLIDSDYDDFDEVVDAVYECITDFYKSCTDALKAPIDEESFETDDCDGKLYKTYVGSILGIVPSGKYYTPWTNQIALDEWMDEMFWECIDELLPDVWFETGEGNATDLYMCRWCE
jgi:hypothetical protein